MVISFQEVTNTSDATTSPEAVCIPLDEVINVTQFGSLSSPGYSKAEYPNNCHVSWLITGGNNMVRYFSC